MSTYDDAPMHSGRGPGPVRYVQAIRQHWKLIVLLVACSVATALLYIAMTPKSYEASTDIAITPISANDTTFQGFSLFRQSFDTSSSVVTAARLFDSPEIRVPVAKTLGADRADISFATAPLTQADIVTITATAPSAKRAAEAANIFAETAVAERTALFQKELASQIVRLRARLNAVPASQRTGNFEYAALAQQLGVLRSFVGVTDPSIRIASRAVEPEGPSWPRPKLTVLAALFASLLLGCGIAVALEITNPRIAREEDLQLEHRLPILARIPKLSSRAVEGYLVGKKQLPSDAWKGYRTLRAALATAGPNGGFPRSILVTSARPGDGKTMTAVNLAITLAAAGDLRVLLVDADFHRPMVATIFNVPPTQPGFAGVIGRRVPAKSVVVPSPAHPNLSLLLAQREHHAQVSLFEASRLKEVLDRLSELADVIVIDAPPVPEVAETVEIAAAVDTVLIAVRLGHTSRDKLDQLREMLARRGVAPVGFVVTTRRGSQPEGAYYYSPDLNMTPQPPASTQVGRRPYPGDQTRSRAPVARPGA